MSAALALLKPNATLLLIAALSTGTMECFKNTASSFEHICEVIGEFAISHKCLKT